jgi:hypothetical protein
LEDTRDRESHLAERVAASVTDGYRSPYAFLRSFKIVAVEEGDITSTASRSSVAAFNLRSFETAVGKGPSGRSGAFLTPSPPWLATGQTLRTRKYTHEDARLSN